MKWNLGLTIDKDVVVTGNELQVKTPVALKRLISELSPYGYEIKKADPDKPFTISRKWYARLPDLERGLCFSCHKTISTKGIESHGHKCERCGATTYLEMVDGSLVKFSFVDLTYPGIIPHLYMKVKKWDTEKGRLYLYFNFLIGRPFVVHGPKAEEYLRRYKGKYSFAKVEGGWCLVVNYTPNWDKSTADIEIYKIEGYVRNYRPVKVYEGLVFEMHEPLPIPEWITFHEAWGQTT